MTNVPVSEFISPDRYAGTYRNAAQQLDAGSQTMSILGQNSAATSPQSVDSQLGQPAAERLLQNHPKQPQPLGGVPKRHLDLAVAACALLLASPLMLIIAILIKVITGGPILFVHRRIGFNGKPFNCYKFRTMVPNSAQVLEEYLARNPEADRAWRECQKLACDPRVNFFGKMLRKSSIDELPQLFNVLRGEMSCVGPRPIVAEELQRYGVSSDEYLKARPGLTGLWQISGRDTLDYAIRISLDTQYVRNWSLWMDISILARTALAVMRFDQAS